MSQDISDTEFQAAVEQAINDPCSRYCVSAEAIACALKIQASVVMDWASGKSLPPMADRRRIQAEVHVLSGLNELPLT